MNKVLPAKFSKGWLVVFVIYFLLISGYFYFTATLILGNLLQASNIMGILILSALISLIVSFSGYVNARMVFYLSTIGLIIGAVMMFQMVTDKNKTGWEDLIGPIVFIEMFVIWLFLGLLVQFAAYIGFRMRRKHIKNN